MNFTGNPPTLLELFSEAKRDVFESINCVQIGKIQSFDAAKKTATVQLMFKRNTPAGTVSAPVLVDVPVFTLLGGSGSIQMPIASGDECLVLFCDRNLDTWFVTGSDALPPTGRCHDLSDGVALVGLSSRVSTLPAYDTHVNISVPGGKKLVVKSTGSATAEILGSASLALLSELQSVVTWLKTHTHSGVTTGGGVTGVPSTLPTDPVGTTKLKGS